VIGIVGDRPAALAVARSLLIQAAGHCGPADLTIGVFADQGRGEDWEWASWLPHTRRIGDAAGGRWLSFHRPGSESLLRGLRDGIDSHPTRDVLLMLDTDVLLEGRDAPARQLLGHGRGVADAVGRRPITRVCGIVIASAEQHLPASCTVIVRAADIDAAGTVVLPATRTTIEDVVLAGVGPEAVRRCAQEMARFDDPELTVPGASLPSLVKLAPLLGMSELNADEVLESWRRSTGISTPVGMGESGPFSVDLVLDGPHGLVGGTTGSGKSEFLRTLVAGLAARNDPTRLTFILIDFKGGAAFRSCEALPHTIGTVSNLDEQLADRAIRALEAEMRYRQEVFAAAGEGVDNLDAYLATRPSTPMPRLLLVVDEFAMLAKEHPDVLSSLVSVGAVGRTLGVHMILATQRPAGVVNDDILANTNLRVALRVQSRDDSVNVVEVPDAAAIGRDQRGRALVKLGQNDITPVQTALVSAPLEAEDRPTVDLRPIVEGVVGAGRPSGPHSEDDDTELDLLIRAIGEASERAGIPAPRPVWPEPLGERVELAGFPAREETPSEAPRRAAEGVLGSGGVAETSRDGEPSRGAEEPPVVPQAGAVHASRVEFALSDDPDHQCQIPARWDMDEGNLLLLGIPGSGTSTALTSIALTLASHSSPEDLDLLILDMGSRGLAPLEGLPHTAGYVGAGPGSQELQARFLKHLRAEVDRRRAGTGPHRRTVVLIDGLATLRDEYQDFIGQELMGHLFRAYADGP
jgi:S-DNA-T family DNA segregation ATPase FtsK/SpoIIIE